MNPPRAAAPNSSAPASNQAAPRTNGQPQSVDSNRQQPAASSASSNAPPPAASNQPTDNQSGQAKSQQPSPSSAQAPASSNQSQSTDRNQNRTGQAQNPQQPSASDNAQAPATQQRPATDRNQATSGQYLNRQTQQNNRRQDQRQGQRPDGQSSASRNAGADRNAASLNVNINDNQRTRVASVISRGNVRPVDVDFRIAAGGVVPPRVALQPLPPDIVAVVPQYRNYRYFVTRDQVVIVEPARKTIIAVIPAGGNARAAAPAADRVTFTDQQRQVIRQRTISQDSVATTGSSGGSRILIEQQVPETVVLQEFPAEIVTEVPMVRTYRYYRQDNDVVVVDPTQRRVIEIIR
jgi:hypothetical protein